MKSSFVSLAMGIVFGLGLGFSQMTNPEKVVNFLDLGGNWDPSLAFVMAGAMTTFLVGYKLTQGKWKKPLFASEFHTPSNTNIDKPLLFGSIIFGIGWSLSGFCPGPGIASVMTFSEEVLTFLATMSLGMILFHYFSKLKKYEDG